VEKDNLRPDSLQEVEEEWKESQDNQEIDRPGVEEDSRESRDNILEAGEESKEYQGIDREEGEE